MATSGTATWSPSIIEIIEEAFERCGLESRVGYDIVTARRSLNYLFAEWANRGLNLWTVESATVPLVAATASYVLPADTVDVIDGAVRTDSGSVTAQSDIQVNRVSFDTYQGIPNKLTQGRPSQYMVVRGTAAPTVYFWQVPDVSSTYTFYYWRLRRIQDAGSSAAFTADVPFRFLPALTSGLAYHIACKKAPQRMMDLKARYDEDWQMASDEDRDRSSWNIVPYVGVY